MRRWMDQLSGARWEDVAAVWLVVRTGLRARWRSWLVLAVLAGLAGGMVIAVAAGARRTDAAYPSLIAWSAAPDALVAAGHDRVPQVSEAAAVTAYGVLSPAVLDVYAPADSRVPDSFWHRKLLAGRRSRSAPGGRGRSGVHRGAGAAPGTGEPAVRRADWRLRRGGPVLLPCRGGRRDAGRLPAGVRDRDRHGLGDAGVRPDGRRPPGGQPDRRRAAAAWRGGPARGRTAGGRPVWGQHAHRLPVWAAGGEHRAVDPSAGDRAVAARRGAGRGGAARVRPAAGTADRAGVGRLRRPADTGHDLGAADSRRPGEGGDHRRGRCRAGGGHRGGRLPAVPRRAGGGRRTASRFPRRLGGARPGHGWGGRRRRGMRRSPTRSPAARSTRRCASSPPIRR